MDVGSVLQCYQWVMYNNYGTYIFWCIGVCAGQFLFLLYI